MSLPIKPREEIAQAIAKFLANGGAVKKPRSNCKTLKSDTWQGSKVTVGFKLKELADNTELTNG